MAGSVELAEMADRSDQVIINEFGNTLRRLREAKKWTQGELADLAGTTTNTISRLETGTNEAGLVTIVRIAEALGVDPGELFSFPR